MATLRNIEDAKVWKDAVKLSVDVINLLEKNKIPYGLKDQMIRSSISIASNIAEGYEYHNKKEFLKFLKYARGSAAELKTQLVILKETYLNIKQIDNYINSCSEIIKQIQGFSAYLRKELNN